MFWVWYLVVVQPHVQLVKINIAIIIIAVAVVVVINTFDASDNDTTKWKLFLKRTCASIQCLLKKPNNQPNKNAHSRLCLSIACIICLYDSNGDPN